MKYQTIKHKIDDWEKMGLNYIRFVDETRFVEENTNYSPGAIISKYNYWVIATTIGGNAITISDNDDSFRLCDHTGWYDDCLTFAIKSDYDEREYNDDNVENAQMLLAENLDEFDKMIKNGSLEKIMDKHG